MKIILVLFATIGALTVSSQKITVYFKTGSTAIPDSSIKHLVDFAREYDTCYKLIIVGLSDGVGSNEANSILSLKRADAVREIIDATRSIEMKGVGESEAQRNNDTTENQFYRRVDVFAEKQLCEDPPESTIADLYHQLQDKGQEFCINPNRDTALVGKNGTIVYYKQGTFKNTTGCTCLKLVLHEFYKKSDLIMNNLTTTSDGRPLESGGMTKLEGFCGKDSLQYEAGKFLTVMMPTDTLLPGMKLLSANRDNITDILNWQLDEDYSDIDGVNWNRLWLWCGFRNAAPAKCPFFFCKIGRFFNRMFGGSNYVPLSERDKEYERERKLLEKYGMKEEKLGEALLLSKKNNPDALNYYVYRNANWNYHNIDRFANGEPIVDYIIEEIPDKSKDVKLVVKITKTILPGIGKTTHYVIEKLFSKMPVWIVGLRYYQQQSYLALQEGNTSVKPQPLQFNPVTVDELKQLLKKLD